MMTPEELTTYTKLFSTISDWLVQIRSHLPKKEQEAATSLIQELKVREVGSAQLLGYPICRCSWPPTIMLKKKDVLYDYYCPACGQEGALGQLLEH
jgi:hypothetical protein